MAGKKPGKLKIPNNKIMKKQITFLFFLLISAVLIAQGDEPVAKNSLTYWLTGGGISVSGIIYFIRRNFKGISKKLKEIIDDYDPDIICGHNINGFDLPFILGRMDVLGIQKNIGRTEKSAFARKLQHSYMPSVSGRVIVDTFEIYKRDPWVKFKRYDLSTISKAVAAASPGTGLMRAYIIVATLRVNLTLDPGRRILFESNTRVLFCQAIGMSVTVTSKSAAG